MTREEKLDHELKRALGIIGTYYEETHYGDCNPGKAIATIEEVHYVLENARFQHAISAVLKED